jgi:hypothetical protein
MSENNRKSRKLAREILQGKNTRLDTLKYPLPVIKGAYQKLKKWGYIK